jgi:hypothetical protein
MPDPRLVSILDQSGDAATVAWAHQGVGSLVSLADPELAIAAAAELGNVAALQSVTEPKALRKAASAALHRLKSRGVKVADSTQVRSFSLTREQLDVPPRAWLGAPGPMGNHHLVLTATDYDGSCIMEVIVGGDKVQDQHGHAGRNELRRFWKEMETDPTLTEVPFVVGLHLADEAVRGKSVHGWDHFLSKVAPATLASARLVDPMRHALADDGAAPQDWLLPAWLVPGRALDLAIAAIPDGDVDVSNESWLEQGLEVALADASRLRFAAAADQSARVYALLGRTANAASARSVADRLRAGEPAASFPELRTAVLFAAFQEVQRRQGPDAASAGL